MEKENFDPHEDLTASLTYTRAIDADRHATGTADPFLEKLFSYHPPFGTLQDRYQILRGVLKNTAYAIKELVPQCAEQTLAIRKLQEAQHYANAAIALTATEKEAPGSTRERPLYTGPDRNPNGSF